MSYRAFRIHRSETGEHSAAMEQRELTDPAKGEILIRTRFSSVNYKDALAGTGRGKILRDFPLTGGIDSCGDVVQSQDVRFKEGDQVIVTGYGLSSTHDGGYAEYLRVPADWVVPLPDNLGPYQAMAIGTAGFTAALALHRMESNGQQPGMGPILVTGATGGVGSLAVNLFHGAGYEVTAVTGKDDQHDYLKLIGASQVLSRDALQLGSHPLERGRWGGAVDNVGGETLAGLTRTVKPWGSIAAIGLAAGIELNTTVMPFILRGISLLGINSADCPHALRNKIWQRLATDLHPKHLDDIVDRVIHLEQLPEVFDEMLKGEVRGRILVQTRVD
ncbi:oxidoreductase [endosymbiont of Lamellibrachia barhami]|uniref:oxidoreductase n=1 Tax=endosymbiont of Lamellibrachia barhami TaxID=205975 RepID=UPI0015B2B41A|nr:oxidoreductase [endosymbiont of Lamellibrachia barhami]